MFRSWIVADARRLKWQMLQAWVVVQGFYFGECGVIVQHTAEVGKCYSGNHAFRRQRPWLISGAFGTKAKAVCMRKRLWLTGEALDWRRRLCVEARAVWEEKAVAYRSSV